jgi:cellulose synthase/poly-beta-1,6-N-acetylglucosamine synthase-like glycosyltransferase
MIIYTYIGYPLLITLLAKFKKKENLTKLRELPTISIIISVFNEEEFINKKIRNCLNLNYPRNKLEILIGSDGSTDGTDGIIRRYKNKTIRYFVNRRRRGKPYTINKLVKVSKGQILFFTDARQVVGLDALRRLVKHFADKKVGCVSGGLAYNKSKSIVGSGIGSYWKYEKYIREKESDFYSMIGATGAIYACRKKLFEPLPEDIILDDLYTPFVVVNKGYRALFDDSAKAYDVFAETPRDEHQRKIRTLSGNYQIFSSMPHMLNPFKSKIAFQIISHKLFRVLVPIFMIALFLSNLALLPQPFYLTFLVLQSIFYIIVGVEAIFRRHIKGILGVPYLFCVLNFSAFVGLLHFLFNKMDVKWEKAS